MKSVNFSVNQIFAKSFKKGIYWLGDVAQLARALDWQSRGRGFESHLLHIVN